MIFWVALAAGLGVGWIRGGRLERLALVRVRALGLPIAAAGLHLFLRLWRGPAPGPALDTAASVAVYAAMAGFLALNRRLPGALPFLGGLSANLVATLTAGGRMPVWSAALVRVPTRVRTLLLTGGLASHVAMAHPAGLGWLGDVLAVPAPLPADVVSAGDLAIAAGLMLFLAGAMAVPRARAGRARPVEPQR